MTTSKVLLSLVASSYLCFASTGSQSFYLNQGWNLIGIGLENVQLSNFDNAKIIWKYSKSNGWKSYSKLLQNIPSHGISGLNSGDGIWVYVNDISTLSISGDLPSSQQITANANEWSLISPKTIDSSFSVLPIIENNAVIAWSWNNGTWMAFSPNEATQRKLTSLGYKTFDTVQSGKGFWVLPSSSPIVFNKFNDDINNIIKTDSVADTANAKNLVKELRATIAKTYNDGTNPNLVSAYKNQSDLVSSKIVPAVTNVTNDIDSSFNTAGSMVASFGADINTNFKTITDNFSNRVNQWIDVLDAGQTSQTTQYGDAITHTADKFKVTGIGANIEVNLSTQNSETGTSLLYGDLFGDGYTMSITKLNYNLTTKQVEVTATVHFVNTSNNDIAATLNANWIYDKSLSALNSGKNVTFAFDGDIKTGGRIFNGKIRFSDADTTLNYISGKLVGKVGEPTLEGKLVMNSDLNLLKKMSSEKNYKTWGDAFFAEKSDGTNSIILSSSPSFYSSDNKLVSSLPSGNYTFSTPTDSTLTTSCNAISKSLDGTVLECGNGLKVKHIIFHKYTGMEAIVNGKKKVIYSKYINTYNKPNTINFYLLNEDKNDYRKSSSLTYNVESKEFNLQICDYTNHLSTCTDQNANVSNVSYRFLDNIYTLPLNFAMNLSLKDGIKEVSFDANANKIPNEKIWKAKLSNVKYLKGTDGITIDEIKAVVQDLDIKNSSVFWYKDGVLSHIDATNIRGNITSSDGNKLTVNVSVAMDKIVEPNSLAFSDFESNTWYGFGNANINIRNIIKLSGSYQYANSTFQGSVLLDQRELGTATTGYNNYNYTTYVNKNTSIVSVNAKIDGEFGFSGYTPYTLSARIFQNGGKFILSETTGYKLAGKYNDETKELNFGDTNGVRLKGTTNNFSLQDKNGNNLGTFGQISNGNNWEIKYSDNSTETLF